MSIKYILMLSFLAYGLLITLLGAVVNAVALFETDRSANYCMGGGALVLSVVIALYVSRLIARPLALLESAVDRATAGGLDSGIDVGGGDEVRVLARAFDSMRISLKKALEKYDREITERREAEQVFFAQYKTLEERAVARAAELEAVNTELAAVNHDMREFAYVVTHDLKAPLRAISSLAGWLERDYADKLDDEGKGMFRLLVERARRMHNLIEGILHYSRLIHMKDDQMETNLNRLVAEVISDLAVPQHMTTTVTERLPTMLCKKTRMVQIFQNLISNAVKYMDKPHGEIGIGCEAVANYWRFSVADNGPGIEERYFDKIFQLFQTLQPTDEYESSGVGLALVKKIVEQEGGAVWLESRVGQGSTFFFTLPDGNGPG